jgi:hypothetical protein
VKGLIQGLPWQAVALIERHIKHHKPVKNSWSGMHKLLFNIQQH